MKYGCIGERLVHSFSKEIHHLLAENEHIAGYDYDLVEISRNELDRFMKEKDFCGINVTIPYKEAVIPYLDGIEENAKKIGAVNTVVNRSGKLYGYNTDFYGMKSLFSHMGLSLKGKKVFVLGTGGTSKTALAVAESMGAKEITKVSRSKKQGAISYEELYERKEQVEVLINTTPKGMFPEIYGKAVDAKQFPNLSGVLDVVYNPLRTPLILEAKQRKIPAEGGLFMLVAQAVYASEIFLDRKYDKNLLELIYEKIRNRKENIVLTGMPGAGKTTVGRILEEKLHRPLVDTDLLIEKKTGMSIPDIFAKQGESQFRMLEKEAVREVSSGTGLIIATGGGAVLSEENRKALKENGRLYWLNRPLQELIPTGNRPLAGTKEAIEKRYRERYDLYQNAADVCIRGKKTALEEADEIMGEFLK